MDSFEIISQFILTQAMHLESFRFFAITLLDDQHGINAASYALLEARLQGIGADDILAEVQEANGRYFLPEGHNLKP